jgi:hypothetical protein
MREDEPIDIKVPDILPPSEGDSLAKGHKNLRSRSIFNACDPHSAPKNVGVPHLAGYMLPS